MRFVRAAVLCAAPRDVLFETALVQTKPEE
jgi:hypothetical protein